MGTSGGIICSPVKKTKPDKCHFFPLLSGNLSMMPGTAAATSLPQDQGQRTAGMLSLIVLFCSTTLLPDFLLREKKITPLCLTTASWVFYFLQPKAFLTDLLNSSIRARETQKHFPTGQEWARVQPGAAAATLEPSGGNEPPTRTGARGQKDSQCQ